MKLPELLIQYLNDREIANMLGINLNYGCLASIVPNALKKFFNWAEKLEDRSEPLNKLINFASLQLTKKMVEYFNDFKGVPFEIPSSLKDKWDFLET